MLPCGTLDTVAQITIYGAEKMAFIIRCGESRDGVVHLENRSKAPHIHEMCVPFFSFSYLPRMVECGRMCLHACEHMLGRTIYHTSTDSSRTV